MKTAVALLFVSFLTLPAFSKNFPGYYLNKSGDTIQCEFRFKDWNITPESADVIAAGKALKLVPADVKGFGVYEFGDYISQEVQYHKGNYSALDAPDVYSDEITKHSFLKRIVHGKYTLYELTESVHSYFFVSISSGSVRELVYRVKRIDQKLEEDNAYKRALLEMFANEDLDVKYNSTISTLSYNSRSIAQLFRKLNEELSGVTHKAVRRDAVQWDLFIGAVANTFPSSIAGRYSPADNKFGGTTSVSGGVSLVYFTPGHFKNFAVGASIAFNQYGDQFNRIDSVVDFRSDFDNRKTTYTEHFELKNKALMIDLFGMYVINPLDKVRIYLKAGFNTNISLDKENDIYIRYTGHSTGIRAGSALIDESEEGLKTIDTRKLYYNIHGGLGLNAGKHKIEANYYTPGVLNTPLLFKVKMLSLYYYYTISK